MATMIILIKTKDGKSKTISMDARTWNKILAGFPVPEGVEYELAPKDDKAKGIQPERAEGERQAKQDKEHEQKIAAEEKEAANKLAEENKDIDTTEKIGALTPTEEPTVIKLPKDDGNAPNIVSPTGISEDVKEKLLGDVNGDGKVDEKDLSVVHKEYHKAKKAEKKKLVPNKKNQK